MPEITIIIPTYNTAPWLAQTLQSVQEQTYTDFLCLVVDDGSTDNTAKFFANSTAGDPRFRFVPLPHAGVCATRNAGIALVETPLVTMLDSDDIWHPTFLERMVTALSHDSRRLAWCRYAMFVDGSSQCKPQPWVNVHQTGNIWWDMLLHAEFCMGAWVAKTVDVKAAGPFDTQLATAEDRDFLLRLLARCCADDPSAAVGVDDELLFYRQRAGSAVRNGDEALKKEWDTMRRHLEHPLVPARIRQRGYSFLAFKMAVIAAFATKDIKTALRWYFRAVRLCPANMNLYVLPLRKLVMSLGKKKDLPWLRQFLNRPLKAEKTQ